MARWPALIAVGALVVMACQPAAPTPEPTVAATLEPSTVPISATIEPIVEPTPAPTRAPTPEPTPAPTLAPTPEPTAEPTAEPTLAPTPEPLPSEEPMASEEPMMVEETAVTGTVLLPEGSTLEGAAEWSVELQDTSLADAPAVVIGTDGDAVTDATATEIPFEIAYDPTDIEETNTYTLSARIVDADGNLVFINNTSIPVLTRDAPSQDVETPVVQPEAFSPMASEAPSE